MDKPEIILSAETQFAREVALGVIYQLPLPIWYSLIPGMFIFDFLRRNRAISNFTKYYIFPRRLALNALRFMLNGEKTSEIDKRVRQEIEDWLKSQRLLSKDLVDAQKNVIDVLADHYKKLLKVKGTSYNDLIENAYKTRKSYQAHINKLENSEDKIDQIIMSQTNLRDRFKERLTIEARQIKARRNKLLDDIF